jgi:hypothetical protein
MTPIAAAKRALEELRQEGPLAAFSKLIVDWQPVTYQLKGRQKFYR